MENKRTALDILFQEIKESKAVMPDALFGYFEMVYNKAKEIETKQIIEFAAQYADHKYYGTKTAEQYYKETYGRYLNVQ